MLFVIRRDKPLVQVARVQSRTNAMEYILHDDNLNNVVLHSLPRLKYKDGHGIPDGDGSGCGHKFPLLTQNCDGAQQLVALQAVFLHGPHHGNVHGGYSCSSHHGLTTAEHALRSLLSEHASLQDVNGTPSLERLATSK